jgi:energy-converting hydrogenase B subunit D
MSWEIGLIVVAMVIISAVVALQIRDLLASSFLLMAYSFGMALLYTEMGAPDVGFTEVAVGAGVSGVFIVTALYFMKRRSDD